MNDNLNSLGDSGKTAEESTQELDKNLKKLGTDLGEVETGVSKFERATINAFKSIAENSQASGKTISVAFDSALSKIKSPEGIKQLDNELEKLKREGKLTEAELEHLERQINSLGDEGKRASNNLDTLSDGLNEVSDAADGLGGDGR